MREAAGEEREKEIDGSGQSYPRVINKNFNPLNPIRMLKAPFPHLTFNPNSNPFNKPNPKSI